MDQISFSLFKSIVPLDSIACSIVLYMNLSFAVGPFVLPIPTICVTRLGLKKHHETIKVKRYLRIEKPKSKRVEKSKNRKVEELKNGERSSEGTPGSGSRAQVPPTGTRAHAASHRHTGTEGNRL